MSAFRCVVQYSLCALSGYGLVTVAAHAASVPNPGSALRVTSSDDITTGESAVPDGHPLDATMVSEAMREVQGTDTAMPSMR
jgi:hypothetical protein